MSGRLKYFSPQFPSLISNWLQISRILALGVFLEKKALDFVQHILSPASSANKFKLFVIKLIDLALFLQKIIQSSAKQRMGIGGVFLLIWIPSNSLLLCPSTNLRIKKFKHIIKMYGDKESPYLIPL